MVERCCEVVASDFVGSLESAGEGERHILKRGIRAVHSARVRAMVVWHAPIANIRAAVHLRETHGSRGREKARSGERERQSGGARMEEQRDEDGRRLEEVLTGSVVDETGECLGY